ncbi:heavy metal translocating P-type ATPase [Helicobacter kayseriensis]|uniref:heavy metal translocating P-type ATPase n=1 Tax=Helicobacter kayseriensis TaxID=2905877 RepID=UPI001E5309DF|nr:heavy metal translocating P-type ATPase [Helicobacter kayseriensis]MCE3047254.1 cadmium-translocating P-type ATPase [Helicobacter kayseriensis]MCE3048625.1 cadmium-translocating P-type ATPase [Helicobacter kayseriensis]
MKKYKIINLDCPNCAQSLQKNLQKQDFIQDVMIDFSTSTIFLDTQDLERAKKLIGELEEGVEIQEWDQAHQSSSTLSEVIFLGILLASFALSFFISIPILAQFMLYTIYIVAGFPVFKGAYKRLKNKQFFDENFLMFFATIAAFFIGADFEAVAVMLFFRIGEFFENLAVRKSRKNIQSLIDLSPSYAWKKQENGELVKIFPKDLQVGDIVVVKSGEKIPSDGIITQGQSELEEKMINGEPLPRFCKVGDHVFGGSINLLGVLEIQITTPYDKSGISQIISLIDQASMQKSQSERRITEFSKVYTPCVFAIALMIAILPPLFGYGSFHDWIYRALVILMVSCPCALVLSVPLGYFGGIGGASKHGILIKGSNYLEALNQIKFIAFDKTGTLTQGEFEISQIVSFGKYTQEEILRIAMCAEHLSSHPIARSLQKSTQNLPITHHPISHDQIAGKGMSANCCNQRVLAGNKALLESFGITPPQEEIKGTVIYVALQEECIGYIILKDALKKNAKDCIQKLHHMGIETMILSGDQTSSVEEVAQELGIKKAYGGLLPQEKLETFQKYRKEKSAFIGDGINDAPVLSSADVGISMGIGGSDLSKESSDVVLANDDLSKLITALNIAKKTKTITIQNIIFALGVKGIFIVLGIFGFAGMWEAVFGDVGVSLLALANASRILK